jgi:hypothetical protein
MAPQPLGLDLNALQNVTAPVLDFPTDPVQILNEIPIEANEITGGGWLAFGILFTLFIIIYFKLQDKSQFSKFLYSDARAVALSLGICSIMGLVQLQLNYFNDFRTVSFFVIMYTISLIFIFAFENKE